MDIASIKQALRQPCVEADRLPVHIDACCRYLSPWPKPSCEIEGIESDGSYRRIAAIGFALAQNRQSETLKKAFIEGTQQLAGRVYFTLGRAPTIEVDGVALLGLAIGYNALAPSDADDGWLRVCLEQSVAALQNDRWQCSLAKSAQATLGVSSDKSDIDPVLRVALAERKGDVIEEELRKAAWRVLLENIDEPEPTRRAALQRTFEACASALARLPLHGAGVTELIEILDGVSRSMGHWTYEERPKVRNVPTQKWEIDHEYHVQNLLWTILRPIFPDLVDEETLKKLGHTSPRYDLGIPSLSTIIEVKYLRKRGQSALKAITDEIAADHSLYLREGTGFTRMIAFIWDEQRQTEEYQTLQSGLENLGGIERVIIVPRPAKMERDE
ncbi:MAG: hypothetical protein H6847_14115 [Hyphomonas sp.]|nr:hypothetical protein [Hyphomonas sp.]